MRRGVRDAVSLADALTVGGWRDPEPEDRASSAPDAFLEDRKGSAALPETRAAAAARVGSTAHGWHVGVRAGEEGEV